MIPMIVIFTQCTHLKEQQEYKLKHLFTISTASLWSPFAFLNIFCRKLFCCIIKDKNIVTDFKCFDTGHGISHSTNYLSVKSKDNLLCLKPWNLWKFAQPFKQLHLLCPPDPWNLPGTALLSGALKSTEKDCWCGFIWNKGPVNIRN